MVHKVFGICEAKNGTETNELLLTGTDGHQRIWQNAENNSNSGRRQGPAKVAQNWRIEGQKKEAQERSIRDLRTSLKWKVSWRKKACGTLRRTKS